MKMKVFQFLVCFYIENRFRNYDFINVNVRENYLQLNNEKYKKAIKSPHADRPFTTCGEWQTY